MKLIDIDIFVNLCKKANIIIPKDIIYVNSDFEENVPKDMHKHILIEYEGSSIISENVINKFIKENAKL